MVVRLYKQVSVLFCLKKVDLDPQRSILSFFEAGSTPFGTTKTQNFGYVFFSVKLWLRILLKHPWNKIEEKNVLSSKKAKK